MSNGQSFRIEPEGFKDPYYGQFLSKAEWTTYQHYPATTHDPKTGKQFNKNGEDVAVLVASKNKKIRAIMPLKYLRPKDFWIDSHQKKMYYSYHMKCLGCLTSPLSIDGNEKYCHELSCNNGDHNFSIRMYQISEKIPIVTFNFQLFDVLNIKFINDELYITTGNNSPIIYGTSDSVIAFEQAESTIARIRKLKLFW